MPETKRPLKVFLCHAHADRDAVHTLYARLKREGVDAWLDKEKLLPGADWQLEIRKAVHEADVVIVCLSKQFNQAGFRQKEVRIALDTAMEQPEGEIFIIPARLEECENLESLSKWHWVNLFEVDGYHKLIRALRARADRIGATLRIRRGGHSIKSHPKNKRPDHKAIREKLEQEGTEKAKQAINGFQARFDNESTMASSVPREQLPEKIVKLQSLLQEAKDQKAPSCLAALKDRQLKHMALVIDTLKAFLDGVQGKALDDMIKSARDEHDTYVLELFRLLGNTPPR